MAKKIKFGLEMADGFNVRRIEELREHFDLETGIKHFTSGKLLEWLEDRFYDEAEKIGQLDKDNPDFQRQLCEILGVEPQEDVNKERDIDAIARTNEKETILRQKTSDAQIITNAAKTAFDRDDLVELWGAGEDTIYLCGDEFNIPLRVGNVKYVGILGTPRITIGAKTRKELAEKNITFENVELPEHLREVSIPIVEDNTTDSPDESSEKLTAPTSDFTAEELLEAAGKFHLKSFLGFSSDDYGFDWVINEIKHGNDLCSISEREKKITAILRRNNVLDNHGEISEEVVFKKFVEIFEVSQKNSIFLKSKINKLEDAIKTVIMWQMKYMVALKLEPCDDPLDYGEDKNAEWTSDTLYEAVSGEPEDNGTFEMAKATEARNEVKRHLILPSKLGAYNANYAGIMNGTIVGTKDRDVFQLEKDAWDRFHGAWLNKMRNQIDSVLNENKMPTRVNNVSAVCKIIEKIKSEIGLPVGYDESIEEHLANIDDDGIADIGWELKRILAEHFDTDDDKKLECYSSYEMALIDVLKIVFGEVVPDKL